jgi:filamentous hemagglutinin family protein
MKYPQPQLSITNLGTTHRVKFLVRSLVVLGMCSGFTIPTSAQITPGGDGTAVNKVDATTTDITGGKPSGTNLFHSFGTFDLPDKQTANFKSDPGIQNILGRINSGTPSLIDGKIQVNGGSTTSTINLYLMNPAGIVFGKNASLDVNGAFTATTAKAIGFGNGNWFNALGTNNYDLLTGNPDGFAFTNTPGSIFNAANLTTNPGKSITLVGGTVISTGDIKTGGGNISIATVEGGKYVQIKADGSILRLDLPASAANINGAKTFTALSLPDLLTNTGVDLTATGVTVDPKTKVVTLVGNPTAIANAIALGDTVSKQNRSISTGDVITRNLDTSNVGKNGGNIYVESSQAILSGTITTRYVKPSSPDNSVHTGGKVLLNAQTEIKTETISSSADSSSSGSESNGTGGNVTLSTQTKDIIVDYIFTQAGSDLSGGKNMSKADSVGFRGGNVTVKSAGLFRLIEQGRSVNIDASLFGIIDIKHGSKKPFVIGYTLGEPNNLGQIKVTFIPGFTFPDGASGSRGAITTSAHSNGSVFVVYKDSVSTDGISITGKVNPSNPDQQSARQKSKDNCTLSSIPVATSPTNTTTRSSDKAVAPAVDNCKSEVGTGKILQVLTDKK